MVNCSTADLSGYIPGSGKKTHFDRDFLLKYEREGKLYLNIKFETNIF